MDLDRTSILGHAAGLLIAVIGAHEALEPSSHLLDLEEKVQYIIEKYSDGVVDIVTPEFRKALGYKDNK